MRHSFIVVRCCCWVLLLTVGNHVMNCLRPGWGRLVCQTYWLKHHACRFIVFLCGAPESLLMTLLWRCWVLPSEILAYLPYVQERRRLVQTVSQSRKKTKTSQRFKVILYRVDLTALRKLIGWIQYIVLRWPVHVIISGTLWESCKLDLFYYLTRNVAKRSERTVALII